MTDGTAHPPSRRLPVAALLVVALIAAFAAPAAAKGGNGKGNERTTTEQSTTTAALDTDTVLLEPVATIEPVAVETSNAETSVVEASTTETAGVPPISVSDFDAAAELGSMYNVVDQINARPLWQAGITGEGIDVAVIDTGVAPVPALAGNDKVVAMVDLSFEAGVPEAQYLDTYGHGTHMTGIIAGTTPGADPATAHERPQDFHGVAPGAGIVSVKVGDNTGAVDVSQVIAAIDWVVQHRDDGDLNIRIINLSYSTDSVQDYQIDPLARAVENAWEHGIVVVAASGNDGWMSFDGLASPAKDPYVIAVGAAEATDTGLRSPEWSGAGTYLSFDKKDDASLFFQEDFDGRLPDVAAPGAHIASLRAPGSRVDTEHSAGRIDDTLFLGSGTSQAAAVVSGAAALLLDARPELTPDQVKELLRETAVPMRGSMEPLQGQGVIDVAAAAAAPAPDVVQRWDTSDGRGSLEAARGTQHVALDGAVLTGEVSVFGEWDGRTWARDSTRTRTWTGASWTGASWTGASWTGASWTGASWTGASWTGASWTGASWTGASWTGASWTGASWTGASWTGASWTGAGWY